MLQNFQYFLASFANPSLAKQAKIYPKTIEARRVVNNYEACARTFTKKGF